jgi:hypothetical protein
MKKLMTIFGAILFASISFTSCGGGSNENKSKERGLTEIKNEAPNNVQKDTLQKTIILTPKNLQIKIFFKELAHNYDEYYEGEKSATTGKIREKKLFKKEKKCTFNSADCSGWGESCHIREVFDNLIINGVGENVSLIILNNGKEIFKKEKIDMNGEIKFSKKDFKLDNTDTKYKIIVKQGENLLFEGDVNETSQDCYHG